VPTALGSLLSLKYLNLMNNNLIDVPSELGNLTALYRLGLKGNQLTNLPESFAGLKGLVELFITDNRGMLDNLFLARFRIVSEVNDQSCEGKSVTSKFLFCKRTTVTSATFVVNWSSSTTASV